MLNWSARYYPILRQHKLLAKGSILEVGAGPRGLGTFRKVPFTGCDISFPTPARWPLPPIVASATALPFEDAFFDAVVASDVLEHVPPEWRKTVIGETLRTARRLVIFGFPCGEAAHKADEVMRQEYVSRNSRPPVWLDEHMLAPFPEDTLFRDIPGWSVTQFGTRTSNSMPGMRRESRWLFRRVSTALRLFAPWLLGYLLRRADRPPYYRQVFVLTRNI